MVFPCCLCVGSRTFTVLVFCSPLKTPCSQSPGFQNPGIRISTGRRRGLGPPPRRLRAASGSSGADINNTTINIINMIDNNHNSNNTDNTNDNTIILETRCGFAVSPGLQAKVDGFRKAIETHLPKVPASMKHTTCLTHFVLQKW